MKALFFVTILVFGSSGFADYGHEDEDHHQEIVVKAVSVEIGKKGFVPKSELKFKKGEKIVLNITRTTDKTCMKNLKHPKTGKLIELPLNKKVKFEIGDYKEKKEVKLLCGMGMKAGVLKIN